MSLILPDERIREIEVEACMDDAFPVDGDLIDQRMFRNRAIARAQARHMAREMVNFRNDYAALKTDLTQWEFKEKYGLKEVHDFQKSLFAWLRQEGVLDAE